MSAKMNETIKQTFSEKEIIDLITKLVSSPSHSDIEDQESGVAEYIYDFFTKEGIEAEIIPVVDGRNNVTARLKGKGNGKTLLFTGHTDTVPPYDMPGDPYKVRTSDGNLYGRGVVDMKGPLACMMLAMAAIKRAGVEPEGDLLFAGVIDEEAKSEGTRALLRSGFKADAAIVGEPSDMQVCVGHRGLEWFEFAFHGKTVHGGRQKEGINAIQKATMFINRLEDELIPAIEKRTYPIIGNSSMNYGYIKGGTQPSTVAGECILQIDRRWIPGEKYNDVLSEYQKILDELHEKDPKFNADFKVMDISYMDEVFVHEVMDTDVGEDIVKVSRSVIAEIAGAESEPISFPAWTDGGLINSYAKIPTIVLGPGGLESAHSASEHIEIDSLVPAVIIYALIAVNFCR
jgi:acetylornithine deacetylase/succinyl-diaminopimelate desuccinylase family protein